MSGGGCAYRQDLPGLQAAKRLRELADQVEQGRLVQLSVSTSFGSSTARVDYYGAGYKPLGGAGDLPHGGVA